MPILIVGDFGRRNGCKEMEAIDRLHKYFSTGGPRSSSGGDGREIDDVASQGGSLKGEAFHDTRPLPLRPPTVTSSIIIPPLKSP